jgi:hypothetical protein
MARVALDRVVHLSGQPLAARGKRGEHPADLGAADAELGLGLRLKVLVGQLRGVVAEQYQDVDGSRGGWATNRSARAAVIPPGAGPGVPAWTVAV